MYSRPVVFRDLRSLLLAQPKICEVALALGGAARVELIVKEAANHKHAAVRNRPTMNDKQPRGSTRVMQWNIRGQ